jgi:hypothetical protein
MGLAVSFRMIRVEKYTGFFFFIFFYFFLFINTKCGLKWLWRRMCVLSICQDLGGGSIHARGCASSERQPPLARHC